MNLTRKKAAALLLALALSLAVFTGCTGESTSPAAQDASPGDNAPEPAGDGASGPASSGDAITLVVWDTFTDDEMSVSSAMINEMFEAEFPAVTVERVSKSLDAMTQTLKAAFMSGDAPDVIYHEMGIGEMGSYVQAGYLLNLTDAYASYGWNDTVAEVSAEVPSVEDFIFGVGSELETMSLYYNKTVYEDLGLGEPATIEELTEQFAAIKNAGYTPLANTLDSSWSNNMNFIGTILYSYMSVAESGACMEEDASWDLPSVRSAAQTILDWLEAGYFPDHPEVDGEQRDFFLAQEAVCWVTGNWSIGYINENVGGAFEPAIIPFPGSSSNPDGGCQVNFVGSGYMVSALSEHQKEALDYVDFNINRADTAVIWVEVADIIPPYELDYDADISPLLNTVVDYLADDSLNNIAGINMWLGSISFDYFSDAGQKLAIGALDADSFIQEAEAARTADMEAGNTKGSFSFR